MFWSGRLKITCLIRNTEVHGYHNFHLHLVSKGFHPPLEPVCCKKQPNKSPNQETGLGNMGHLKVLNEDTKLVLNEHEQSFNHLRSVLYHSGPLVVPYSPNQFLGWDIFVVSYSKPALACMYDTPSLSSCYINWFKLHEFWISHFLQVPKRVLGGYSLYFLFLQS